MNVIFLDNTKRLMAKVGAAPSQQLKYSAHFYESSATNVTEDSNVGQLNGTTWVEIVGAATVRRGVKEATFYNPDSAAQTLTLAIDISGAKTEILSVEIAAGSFFLLSTYEVSVSGANGVDGSDGFYKGQRWIPAFSILPTKTNAAYYLNEDKPGRVFSDIAKDGMRIILNADEIPEGTTGIKVKIEAHHFNTGSPANRDVAWELKAGWYNDNAAATLGTAVMLMQTLDANNEKTAISAQSGTVTINGTEGTDDTLELTIHRDYDYSSGGDEDDLASECKITRVNLEFITT